METRHDRIGRATRSPGRRWLAIAALLVLALPSTQAEAGPIRHRAQAIAARTAAQQALLRPNAGTRRAAAAEARNQAFQLRREAILSSQAFQRQEGFFARALEQGMARVPRPQFLQHLLVPDVSGLLPESSTIDYLRWRRGLNPARFDRYHPWMGPILERDRIVRNQVPIPMPPVNPPTEPHVPVIPPAEPPGPILGGGRPSSPQVPIPEPGTMTLWLALGLGGAFALNRRRRHSSG